jgi:hypothetical protein
MSRHELSDAWRAARKAKQHEHDSMFLDALDYCLTGRTSEKVRCSACGSEKLHEDHRQQLLVCRCGATTTMEGAHDDRRLRARRALGLDA